MSSPRLCRVVTRNFGETYTVCFEGTRAACRAWAHARWRHWPPFAVITTRINNFARCFFSTTNRKDKS